MADVAAGLKPEGAAYWSRDHEDRQPVYVPGVSDERNLRPRQLRKGQKTEAKAKGAAASNPAPMEVLKRIGEEAGQQEPDKGETKSASLKDLCPEDKRRIANLIKELARVSEEKEVTEERLKAEQEAFEKKIRQLEDQNVLIIKEREALQHQYRECQELLSLYQKYLSEQQEKLTHSLSELEATKQKEHQMSSQRGHGQLAPDSDLHGSYLGVAKLQTLHKDHNLTRRSPSLQPSTRPGRNRGVLEAGIPGCQTEAKNSGLLQNGLPHKCNHGASPATRPLAPQLRRTPDGEKRRNGCPLPGCPFHQKLGNSAPHESFQDACRVRDRYPGVPCESSLEYFGSPHLQRPKAGDVTRAKEANHWGRNFSEEKRKELLLQKIELEIEKERLQNLLAEQEAKLLQQQEQLQQSRREYHRFKTRAGNPEDGLMGEALMGPGSSAPAMNGICDGLSSPKMDCEGCLLRTPSRRSFQAPEGNERVDSGMKSLGFNSDMDGPTLWDSTKKEPVRTKRGTSGKDPATSPGVTAIKKELVTAATSPMQQGAWRYETSLLDLVAAMSPSRQEDHHGFPRGIQPQSRTCGNPRWDWRSPRAKNGLDDLEESRILEEIFFI
ncbi:protein hinderin isoform X2 [Ahaetulla prasina]|uniref:protein hinderin isoform X2 n=1 Tax=Ahaetulla prasina TaxID=499056 RepID=UPI0026493B65|nr:protein hinderin isoform X2 [Ahaetulla prasina]